MSALLSIRREILTRFIYAMGHLEGPVEELEIAPLQGVVGLRALRITAAQPRI